MTHAPARPRSGLRIAAAALTALGLSLTAACSGASSEDSSVPTASLAPVSADAQLAAQVPQKFKDKGSLTVGTDASYAPNEFVAEDGVTIVGLNIDIMNAVAAKLGLETELVNSEFGTIVLGVTSGKFDAGISSFTINQARVQQVDMVQYMMAGTAWAVRKGNPDGVDLNNLCGRTVAVQKGTKQAEDLATRSTACTDAGQQAITQVVEVLQSRATTDLVTGKAEAMVSDSPVIDYAIGQQSDQLERLGDTTDAAPYGILLSKGDPEMGPLVSRALVALQADGSYQAILDKWSNAPGAVTEFPVNPQV